MYQFVIFLLLIVFIVVTVCRVEICATESCRMISNDFKMGMKSSINPCDDFYERMCGAWKEMYTGSNAVSYVDTYSFLQRNLNFRILDILKDKSASASSKSLSEAKELYKTCKLASIVNKDGPKSLLAQIEKRGGWPLLSSKLISPAKNIWQNYLKVDYHFLLGNPLFNIDIGQRLQSSRTPMIIIKQPDLFFSETNDKESQDQRDKIKSYGIYILDVVSYINKKGGKCNNNKYIKEEIGKMIQFELKLTEIRGGEFMVLQIQDFQKIYDENGGNHPSAEINWLEIIQFQFKQFGFNIESSEMIKVFNMQFFRQLPTILEAADSHTIANYIAWSFVRSKISFSGRTLISKKNEYEQKIYGGGVVGDQGEMTCLKNPNLEKAISLEYVKRYFPDSNKRKVTELMNYIFKVYEDALKNIAWLDPKSRENSVEKLRDVKKFVGYPNSYTSDAIDDYYKNLKFGANYLETIINLQEFEYLTKLSKLRETINRSEWIFEPLKIAAHYNSLTNSITVTAALLQFPVFDPDGPEVLNYAMIGYTIAHEVAHAFDLNARTLGEKRKLGMLCSMETCKNYAEKAKCFIQQYGQYFIPQLAKDSNIPKVDGLKTLGENIADSTGLQIAYYVFKEYQKQNGGIDVRLVGFENITSDQLFFMIHANSKCYYATLEERRLKLQKETHAPPEFRVRGSVSNHRDFPKVFNCKPDAPMNPSNKCSILV
ncbi:membrane metallo-endopeptidase-like 1 isoform X2 [Prorops nasuta]|uniref:membrane metallo-endopeptidase-like 1 isoform X2 n=1 Tax=Prorops nasuta TaxID=863751 RepID=UPI0034CD1436